MPRPLRVVDLFAGAGGTSTGLHQAAEVGGVRLELTAVNHWDVAIETHSRNHPWAKHLCRSISDLNPKAATGRDQIDLLVASPDCTHHSRARGGKPINDQRRTPAWCVVTWAAELNPRVILIENVQEFEDWAPIGSNGRPLPSKRGEVFRAWVQALEALGYRVERRRLGARPFDLDWARWLRDQCEGFKTAFFLKQLGSKPFQERVQFGVGPWGPAKEGVATDWLKLKNRSGADPSEWPEDLRVQQFPGGSL